MVATASADSLVEKGRGLSGPEEYFCRLIAYEGKTQTAAYRIAYKCAEKSAPELASRRMSRPHIQSRIRELKRLAASEAAMTMSLRREVLGKIALHKSGWRAAPSYQDRIAAIREDATLAGERLEQSTVTGDITLTAVLRALERTAYNDPIAGTVPSLIVDLPPSSQPEALEATQQQPAGAPQSDGIGAAEADQGQGDTSVSPGAPSLILDGSVPVPPPRPEAWGEYDDSDSP